MFRGHLCVLLAAPLASGVVALVGCRTEDPAQTPSSGEPSDPPADADADSEPPVPDPAPVEQGPPLTREEVRLVVRSKMAEVRACFADGLTRDASLGGRVVLQFTIDASGRASAIELAEDQLGADSGVPACLREALARWQFPRPRGGRPMSISYPFVFSSEQSLRAAGLPRVEGTVKPKAVGAVFDAHRFELDECLPEGAKGMVSLAFTLDERGEVTRMSLLDTTLEQPAADCVARAAASWRYPATAAGDEARVNHELWW